MKWNEVSIHPTPNSYSESATPTKDNTVVIPVFSSVHWFTIGAEVKIMPKGNPSPKITEAFLEQQKPKYGEPLGPGRTVRFTEAVDQIVWAMSDRQEYIRQAVERQLRENGLLPP